MSDKYNRQDIVNTVPQKGFFGHPKGLFTLFFTEFWERFSYYGMRAILVFYMYYELSDGGLGLDQTTALSIMSIYGSLVYMSGVIGGWLADRIFGTSKAVFYGGILIMFGHIALAIPGSLPLFFVSMVLIVLGTGLLKPNVSSVVGEIYAENDDRRDAGFSIFYMGINMGAFIAPLIVGTVGMNMSFHLGFSIAAVGMFLGLVVFMLTKKKNLGLAGTVVANPLTPSEKSRTIKVFSIGAIAIAAIVYLGLQTGFLTFDSFIASVGILGILLPTAYFVVMYRSKKTTEVERSRILAYIPLFIASVMFWAIQEQGSTILAAYADTRTDLEFAGITISPAWFQSLNPLFIIVLAPVFAWMWVKLGSRQPSIPQKFSLGLLFAGISFLVILLPAYFGGPDTLVNPLWLVLSYLIIVLGELALSPVGLSATTKLAPAAFSAQTMSLWFLSNAAAQAINAQLVKFYSAENEMMYFGIIGGASIVLSIILFLLAPTIQRYMRGVR
ncbi:POT family proton-dependent oligopeptide transporter [Planomicrobium koreense]|uniref:POT family proton-dependent oligopeptide transporter n=1 Tax=Planococcus koreensis TaxID=112331 RepID=A0A7W8FU96_9BACL|nr:MULTISPECIES: peptide MFS transporter [Planococcus]MBB5181883.1 POT family proton-dependent oligopeptide transporter [Planococcus koreensis]MDN3449949.1 peptide MFS transporter [Planococcus sp. APC 3906]